MTLQLFLSLVLPPEDVGIPGKFGLLMAKNGSLGPWQMVNTGAKTINLISETVAYNGKTQYNVISPKNFHF
jgi:hypothetical protein